MLKRKNNKFKIKKDKVNLNMFYLIKTPDGGYSLKLRENHFALCCNVKSEVINNFLKKYLTYDKKRFIKRLNRLNGGRGVYNYSESYINKLEEIKNLYEVPLLYPLPAEIVQEEKPIKENIIDTFSIDDILPQRRKLKRKKK